MDESHVDDYRLAMSGRVPCGICGECRWHAFGSPLDGKPTRLVLGTAWSDGAPAEDLGVSVIASACRNCGHVRFFVADLFAFDTKDDAQADPQL